MALNKNIFFGTVTGSLDIYKVISGVKKTSFQITHPNTGTLLIQVSNSTQPVQVTNNAQMASIGWSDLGVNLPVTGTKVFLIDFTDPEWASVTTINLECLDYQFIHLQITDTGNYIIDQHINDLLYTHDN